MAQANNNPQNKTAQEIADAFNALAGAVRQSANEKTAEYQARVEAVLRGEELRRGDLQYWQSLFTSYIQFGGKPIWNEEDLATLVNRQKPVSDEDSIEDVNVATGASMPTIVTREVLDRQLKEAQEEQARQQARADDRAKLRAASAKLRASLAQQASASQDTPLSAPTVPPATPTPPPSAPTTPPATPAPTPIPSNTPPPTPTTSSPNRRQQVITGIVAESLRAYERSKQYTAITKQNENQYKRGNNYQTIPLPPEIQSGTLDRIFRAAVILTAERLEREIPPTSTSAEVNTKAQEVLTEELKKQIQRDPTLQREYIDRSTGDFYKNRSGEYSPRVTQLVELSAAAAGGATSAVLQKQVELGYKTPDQQFIEAGFTNVTPIPQANTASPSIQLSRTRGELLKPLLEDDLIKTFDTDTVARNAIIESLASQAEEGHLLPTEIDRVKKHMAARSSVTPETSRLEDLRFLQRNRSLIEKQIQITADQLFDSMASASKQGIWQGDQATQTENYARERKKLIAQVKAEEQYNPERAAAMREKILANDRNFLRNNPNAIPSYTTTTAIDTTTNRQVERIRLSPETQEKWESLIDALNPQITGPRLSNGQLIDRINNLGISDPEVRQTAYHIAEKVNIGKTTPAEAQLQLNKYIADFESAVKVFQTQAQQAPNSQSSEQSRLQINIDKGAEKIKDTFQEFLSEQIGTPQLSEFYGSHGIKTKTDKEIIYIRLAGWDSYDKEVEKAKLSGQSLNLDSIIAIKLGERQLSRRSDLELFAQEITSDFLTNTKGITDKNALIAEARKVFKDKVDKFIKVSPTEKANLLVAVDTSTTLPQSLNQLINSPELQAAMTAARLSDIVLPNLKSAVTSGISNRTIDRRMLTPLSTEAGQTSAGPEITPQEFLIEKLVREDYRASIKQILSAAGIRNSQDPERVNHISDILVLETLGGFIPNADGSEWERKSALEISVKSSSYLDNLILAKMTPDQREEYLKKNPDVQTQRLNAILATLRYHLQSMGINPDQKLNTENLLSRAGKEGLKLDQNAEETTIIEELQKLYSELHKDEVQKILDQAKPKTEVKLPSTFALAKQSYFTSVMGLLSSDFAERKIQHSMVSIVNLYTQAIPLDTESKKDFIWEALVNRGKAERVYEQGVKIFLYTYKLDERMSIEDLYDLIKQGKTPEGVGLYGRASYRNLLIQQKWLERSAAFRAKHTKIAALLDARAKFLERDDVSILNAIIKSDNPFSAAFTMGINFGINKAILSRLKDPYDVNNKVFFFNRSTKKFEIAPLYRFKTRLNERVQFLIEKNITRPLSKVFSPITGSISGFVKTKLLARAPLWLLKTLALASTGIGLAIKALVWLSDLPGIKQLKQLIQILLLSITLSILNVIWTLVSPLISLYTGARALLSGLSIGNLGLSSLGQASVGLTLPSFSVPLLVGGGAGAISGFVSSIGQSLAQNLAATYQSISAKFAAWLNAGGVPTAATFAAVGTTMVGTMVFNYGLLNAFRDAPDKITGLISTSVNPLSVVKTVDKLQANQGERLKYTISVKSPPCAKELIVTDSIPEGSSLVTEEDFLPSSDAIPSIGPIESIVSPTALNGSGQLVWRINIKASEIKGPCSSGGGSSVGELNNDSYLTFEEVKAIISNTVIGQTPALVDPTFTSIDQVVNLILNEARANKVNPMLVLAIFQRETQVGQTGPGKPNNGGITRPKGAPYGCNNLGNMRPGEFAYSAGASRTPDSCLFGRVTDDPSTPNIDESLQKDPFALFSNYSQSIKATFALSKAYINQGISNVGQFADKYSPASDCTVGCDVGSQKNQEFKAIVGCSIQNKRFCADPTGSDIAQAATVITNLYFYADITASKLCLKNTANAQIGGGSNGDLLTNQGSVTTSVGGEQCNTLTALPAGDVLETMRFMCTHETYKVCPTIGEKYPPKSIAWTKEQLESLWRVTQKVYQAEPYRSYAVGQYGIEVQRSQCYIYQKPGTSVSRVYCPPQSYPDAQGNSKPDFTRGFNQGTSGNWSVLEKNGTRLPGTIGTKVILIMDTINGINTSPNILDYLYAHEIAHSAQNGSPDGGIDDNWLRSEANSPVLACNETVSTYGSGSTRENNADAISYYMTLGEEGGNYQNYAGNSNNLKTDHPCTYNALKNGFFKTGPNNSPIEYDIN